MYDRISARKTRRQKAPQAGFTSAHIRTRHIIATHMQLHDDGWMGLGWVGRYIVISCEIGGVS